MSNQLRPTDAKRLGRYWRKRTEDRLALILESVGQPFNVGSVLRSAAAFAADTVWLAGATSDPTRPQVGKTALGTERKLHLVRTSTAAEAAEAARQEGYRVVAVELTDDAEPFHRAELEGDVCLVLGGEDHGCSRALLAAADAVAYIPLPGRVGSLNVAVAGAVAMAEARRREWSRLPAGESRAGRAAVAPNPADQSLTEFR